MITLHSLTPSTRRTHPKRVGRGNASGKGTTAGRGTKGQRARTGGRNKLIRRSLKHLIERTPKVRGFRSRRTKLWTVNISDLQRVFADGTVITPTLLHEMKMIGGTWPGVKILGDGVVKKKLTVKAEKFSAAAAAAIRQAGGTVVELASKPTSAEKPETSQNT